MGLITAVKAGLHSGDNNATAANTGAGRSATTQSSGQTVRCEAQNAPVVQETVHQREREEVSCAFLGIVFGQYWLIWESRKSVF